MSEIPFVGGSYDSDIPEISIQRTINMFPEIVSNNEATSKYVLRQRPGVGLWESIPSDDVKNINGGCRGMTTASANGKVYGVWGGFVYEIDYDKSIKKIATIANSTAPVSIVDCDKYLGIADGHEMYLIDYSDYTIKSPTLPFSKPTHIAYMFKRIYAICDDDTIDGTASNSSKVYWSYLIGDSEFWTWNALNHLTAETKADANKNICVMNGKLWVFGTLSYQIMSPTATGVSNLSGGGGDIGLGSEWSLVTIGQHLYLVGSGAEGANTFYTNNGYNLQRISNPAIERDLAKASEVDDVFSTGYMADGHSFVLFGMVKGDKTLVYDITTRQFFEWSTRDRYQDNHHKFNISNIIRSPWGTLLCGDFTSPNILVLDPDKCDDWSVNDSHLPRLCERISPTYRNLSKIVYYASFELDMEHGDHKVLSGQGSEPKVMLSCSDDGREWFDTQTASIGAQGQYKTRTIWRRLGSSKSRTFKVSISDPVYVCILHASADMHVGGK